MRLALRIVIVWFANGRIIDAHRMAAHLMDGKSAAQTIK